MVSAINVRYRPEIAHRRHRYICFQPHAGSGYDVRMARILLDQMIWEMGLAFDVLYASLHDLGDDDWTWVPPGGVRSIHAIVGHVISCKVMYDNHAFGDASLTWMDPRFGGWQASAPAQGFSPAALVDELRESDLLVRRHVDALGDDVELSKPRGVNWGGKRETRWIVSTVVHHDAFHAGEINHIRALHQRNDRWEWEQEE
jgi:hypothetical protein